MSKKIIKICLSVLICLTVLPTATLSAQEEVIEQTEEVKEVNENVEEKSDEDCYEQAYEILRQKIEDVKNKYEEKYKKQTEEIEPQQQTEESQPQQESLEQPLEQIIEPIENNQDSEIQSGSIKGSEIGLKLYQDVKQAYENIKEEYKQTKERIKLSEAFIFEAIEQKYNEVKENSQNDESFKGSIDVVVRTAERIVEKILDKENKNDNPDLLKPIIDEEVQANIQINSLIEEIKESNDKGETIKQIVSDAASELLKNSDNKEKEEELKLAISIALAARKELNKELIVTGHILRTKYDEQLKYLAIIAKKEVDELENEIINETDEDVDYGYVEFVDKDEFVYSGKHLAPSFTLYNVDDYEVEYYARGTFGLMDEVDETILPGKYAVKVKYSYTVYEDLIPHTVEAVRVKDYEIKKADVIVNWSKDLKKSTYDGNPKQLQVTLDGLVDYADYPVITFKQVIIGEADQEITQIQNAGIYVIRAAFNDEFYDKYNVLNDVQTLVIDKVKVYTFWDESFWQHSSEIDRQYCENGYTVTKPQFKVLKDGQFVDPEVLGFDISENFEYDYEVNNQLITSASIDSLTAYDIGDYFFFCLADYDYDEDNFEYPQDYKRTLHIKQGEFNFVWPEEDLDVMYDGLDKLEAIRQDIYYRIGEKEYKGETRGQIDFYLVDDDGNKTLLDGELSAPGTYRLEAQAADHLDQTQLFDRRYLYIHDEGYVIDYTFDDLTYNGEFQKPVPKFTYNGKPITINEDLYHVYIVKEVAGEKIATVAKNAGAYKAIVRFKDGKHILKDEDVRYFNINKKKVEVVLNQKCYEYSGWFAELDIEFEGVLDKDRSDIYFFMEYLEGNGTDVGEHECVLSIGSDEKYPKVKHCLRYVEDKTGWQIVDAHPCLNDTYQNYELDTQQISYTVYPKLVSVKWLNTCKEYTGEVLKPDFEISGIVEDEVVKAVVETNPNNPIEVGRYEATITLVDDISLASNYTLINDSTIFLIVEQGSEQTSNNISVGSINLSNFVNNAKLKIPTLDEIYTLINTGDLSQEKKDELLYAIENNLDIRFFIVIKDIVDDSDIEYPKNHDSLDTLLLDIKLYVNVQDSMNIIELNDLGDYKPQISLLLNEQGSKKLTIGANRTYFERRIHDGEIVDETIPTPIKLDAGYLISFASNKFSIFGFYSRPILNPNNGSKSSGYHAPKTGDK